MTRRKRKTVHVAIGSYRRRVCVLGVFFDKLFARLACAEFRKRFPGATVSVDTMQIGHSNVEAAIKLMEG